MQELNGKPVAAKIKAAVQAELQQIKKTLSKQPNLLVLQYGNDQASKTYANRIEKNCQEVGINFSYEQFNKNPDGFKQRIRTANLDPEISAIMIQQPLTDNLKNSLELISPSKDVEGITSASLGKLFIGLSGLKPCTAEACLEIINYYGIKVTGKKAAVIGRSNIVGKPIAMLLQQADATVTICHSKTKNLAAEIKAAEIIIAAAGKAALITAEMLSSNSIVIDVGTNFVQGKLVGDVDYLNASRKVSKITPVPGGVGTVTNQVLMRNIVKAFKNIHLNNK